MKLTETQFQALKEWVEHIALKHVLGAAGRPLDDDWPEQWARGELVEEEEQT